MERSSLVLLLGVTANILIVVIFYGTLDMFKQEDIWVLPVLHYFFLYLSIALFSVALTTFILAAALEPGYLQKKFDFVRLVAEFLQNDIDLIHLCTYCELIKSESSQHC
jgi:hypothetical protein